MNDDIEQWRARIESAPVAVMDTRDALGLCAPTEEDFPALYALQGNRVRLVLDETAENKALRDVVAERRRQISAEGWTPDHDDEHNNGELADAAACYAVASMRLSKRTVPDWWPWADDWWKPACNRRNLVRAGALILAEIERLDRAASKPADEERG